MSTKACSQCHAKQPKGSFTNSQWNKRRRRCISCVAASPAAPVFMSTIAETAAAAPTPTEVANDMGVSVLKRRFYLKLLVLTVP